MSLRYLYHAQGGLCFYCLRPTWASDFENKQAAKVRLKVSTTRELRQRMATREHLLRREDGGTLHPANVVMACSQCNGSRLRKPVLLHLADMRNGVCEPAPISGARVEMELWKEGERSGMSPLSTKPTGG